MFDLGKHARLVISMMLLGYGVVILLLRIYTLHLSQNDLLLACTAASATVAWIMDIG